MILEHFYLTELKVSDKVKESLLWNEDSKNIFTLNIGNEIPIPLLGYNNNLKVGLGWKSKDQAVDLDASLLMFDK